MRVSPLVHVFNNYYRGCEYGVAATMDAAVLVEGNYFDQVKEPTHTKYGKSKLPGRLVERKNVYVSCGGPPETLGEVPEPSYTYSLDEASDIPALVSKQAGVGKL